MDIMMPKMDGIEAVMKLREISNVPIIFLTAKSEDVDKILGLDIGRTITSRNLLTHWSSWPGSIPTSGGTPVTLRPQRQRIT